MDFDKQLEAMRRRHAEVPQQSTSLPEPMQGDVLLYQSDDQNISVSVYFYNETFWMNVKAMAELFECSSDNISVHLKNIYFEQELDEISTTEFFSVVQTEGNRRVKRSVKHYSLDAIISVGYRVNSKKATKFRQWATKTLKEYMIKGFVINDDMLKNGTPFGQDYFDELLERIKEIRADIYSQCSYDYDKDSEITQKFFKTVQNKLLFAVTQKTAPEIIHSRANSQKEHMGLTTWKDSPDGKIHKSDVTVSKNYLSKEEISSLNDIVTMYLDYAENQAKRNKLMSMQDWIDKLDSFLKFNEYELLHNAGFISSEVAKKLAIKEYEIFRVKQDESYVSDFDAAIKKYK